MHLYDNWSGYTLEIRAPDGEDIATIHLSEYDPDRQGDVNALIESILSTIWVDIKQVAEERSWKA